MKHSDPSTARNTVADLWHPTRRKFLVGAAAALAAPYIVPATSLGKEGSVAPSERIGTGHVGMGGRGNDHLRALIQNPGVQVLAVCDPFEKKREDAKKFVENRYARQADKGDYKGCLATSDFRQVLARPDVDAIVVATPEFWHALVGAGAVAAGKDVYGEKALTLTIAEGRALVSAVRRHARIFQAGTQQRSDRNFRFACELARNGYLGKLRTVKVAVPGGRALPNAEPKPVPPDLDYEMWLGPAPWTPYNDLKCSFNWYFIYDYCIGWIQSWGVHHVDIALWGAPAFTASTLEVEGKAVFPTEGQADTSISWEVECRTPDGLRMLFTDESHQPHGCRFEGDKGWVHVVRGGIKAEPESLLKATIGPNEEHLYESKGHHENFLECIKSRRDPAAPVEACHAATTASIVCDIATRLGRKLTWDWKAEKFTGDDAANRFISRPMRAPWSL
ncbi:MAG: Gfo/Idh/MocA family oxidoreductase [Planctomycetota bacterium]|nr:Gfo/Idh/MocA family oxidoreductase [Planctomycetota bacterium]